MTSATIKTRVSRSIEIFGWVDFALGLLIWLLPNFTARLFGLPPLWPAEAGLLRIVGILVTLLGYLYIVNGRGNSLGFAVGSLLDRPIVPVIMLILWLRHDIAGSLAAAFSVVDFSGFLFTAFAWHADQQSGSSIGGPELRPQARATRSTEIFGWLLLAIGLTVVLFPAFSASLLELSAAGFLPNTDYLRLIGLLSGGLGMLLVVGSSLDNGKFAMVAVKAEVFAVILATLTSLFGHVPRILTTLLIALSVWAAVCTALAARADRRHPLLEIRVPLLVRLVSDFFAFLSGVIRNARVFHPDGRVFAGVVRQELSNTDVDLAGLVLMRIGMGLMKRGMPVILAKHIPDAPSIAARFHKEGEDDPLDLLATAGGDRLWKLVWNLATGGHKYGLTRWDYFANEYYADVPYRIGSDNRAYWVRITPAGKSGMTEHSVEAREHALSEACQAHATLSLEIQPVETPSAGFTRLATIEFDTEIAVDQEALHFHPFAARGFTPYGFFTGLRSSVYPASRQSRPHTQAQRANQEYRPCFRLWNYWLEVPCEPAAVEGTPMTTPTAPPCRPHRWMPYFWLAVLIIVASAGFYLVERFTRNIPIDYADDATFFVRGSTGGERRDGIPYWVWIALPQIFKDKMPQQQGDQGYAPFGLVYEAKDKGNPYALPLGMSRRNVSGIDVVYLNCAACHVGTVRDAAGAQPRIYPGMPAHQFDLGAFGLFLTNIPYDQRFTPQRVIDQIDQMQKDPRALVPKLDWINRLILRYYALPLMRDQLIILGQRLSFINEKSWGPGRVDTFDAPKALLNFPMQYADPKELMGNADFPSVWYQAAREGMHLHWDGNNTSLNERNLSAAFGTGAYPPVLDSKRVLRMAGYLKTAASPPYPYPIDQALANKGKPLYEEKCLACHGNPKPPFRASAAPEAETCNYLATGAECVGTVIPIDDIGTDRFRFDSYTQVLAVNQSTLYAGYEKAWGFNPPYPQRFSHFRKTRGYAAMPLDGIWLRAPYLHNGSVPSLAELLKPAKERTAVFYRGGDVFDRQNVGFVSDQPAEDGRNLFRFDTSERGNGNLGHDGLAYGTAGLDPEQKRDLIEYLKTF